MTGYTERLRPLAWWSNCSEACGGFAMACHGTIMEYEGSRTTSHMAYLKGTMDMAW